MSTVLAFDIEGNGLLPELTTMWCIGLADVQDPHAAIAYSDHDDNLPPISEAFARMEAADRLVAHNGIGYDLPALKQLFNMTIPVSKVWDTMVVGGLLNPERRSQALASYGEELGYSKGDHSEWHRYSPEMAEYMNRDVEITALLYNKQQAHLSMWLEKHDVDFSTALKLEHGVQEVLASQMNHGFKFDVEEAEILDAEMRGEMSDIEVELQKQFKPRYVPEKASWCYRARSWINVSVFEPKGDNKRLGYTAGAPLCKIKQELFNPSSRQQIASRLSHAYGWIPTNFTPAGTVMVDESTLKDLTYEPAMVMFRYLKLTKQIGMLSEGKNSWLRLEESGRIHGYVKSCGARTHRMSHNRPNVAQVDKDKRMRSLFIPDDGHVLVGADASGLELRLMAAYLYAVDGGKYADAVLYGNAKDGTDVHTINQKAVGLNSRNSAKTFFYAFLYGAGNGKLGQIIIDDAQEAGLPLPSGQVNSIGAKARKRIQTGITGLDALLQYANDTVEQRGFVVLPDGRPVQSSPRTSLNSLLQGAGSILMKTAAVIFHQDLAPKRSLTGHYEYCANVHDELQLSVEPGKADEVGQAVCDAIQMAGEQLGYKIPFAGEYDIGANWSETH